MTRFADPSNPAEAVGDVIELLEQQHDSRFVYRGQTREWPGPLLPSAFRRYSLRGRTYDGREGLPHPRLRGVGRSFVEVEPINHVHEFADSAGTRLSLAELQAIERLVDDADLAWSLARDGAAALDRHAPAPLARRCAANRHAWHRVIDAFHRDRIRQLLCLNGFGFVLGMAVAQHYGFSSEALDVTHDPRIAAFFASRNGPRYVEPAGSGVGVIYRFRLSDEELAQTGWTERTFYTAPSYVAVGSIVEAMSVPHLTVADSAGSLAEHVRLALEGGPAARNQHVLQIGIDASHQTRIVQQRGALLLPDLLLVEQEHPLMKLRTFMAVEDLRTREGFDAFYFRQSSGPDVPPGLTRERLWPAADMFVQMFSALLGPPGPQVAHPSGMILPWRRDLIDRGYAM